MFVVTAVCTAGAGWFIWLYAGDLPPDRAALATFFAVLTMPQIFFYGLYALLGQVLNARSQFAAFAWAPAVANVFAIAGLLAFMALYDGHARPGEWTAGMVWLFAGSATLSIIAQVNHRRPPCHRFLRGHPHGHPAHRPGQRHGDAQRRRLLHLHAQRRLLRQGQLHLQGQ
jgi:putative peptidoglycan lipid II flippase